jgi:4-carboxymuconolactone decarboxylase
MTMIDAERFTRGKRAFAEVMTFDAPEDAAPTTVSLVDFVFAEVWARPGLSRRDRRFVTLPCVAAADAEGPLRDHVYAALNSGDITITEIQSNGNASTASAAKPCHRPRRSCRWRRRMTQKFD